MLKKVLIAVAVVVAALIVIIAKQPENFSVTKNLAVDATQGEIFANINDLNKWESWSPWAKLDPSAKATVEGSTAGAGSTMKWSSTNKEVGEGSMKIVESVLNEFVKLELVMVQPYKFTSNVDFSLKPINDKQTIVTWTISGKKTFAAKAMSLFSNCEEKLSKTMDDGLANLRKVSEEVKGAAAPVADAAAAPADAAASATAATPAAVDSAAPKAAEKPQAK